MSKSWIAAKAAEVAARGLMAYPRDSIADTARIEGLRALLDVAVAPLLIALPACGLKVSFDPRLPPELLYYMTVGDYEQADIDIARLYVRPGDVVLEVGAGIGVTGCALALASGNAAIVVEANPRLWPHIETNFKLNNVELVLVKAAAVADDWSAPTVSFQARDNYWWSSLAPAGEDGDIVADAMRLSDIIARYQPSVLVIDIEGAESSVIRAPFAACVKRLFIEIHTPTLGTEATGDIVARIEDMGFRLRDIRALTWVFERA